MAAKDLYRHSMESVRKSTDNEVYQTITQWVKWGSITEVGNLSF